MKRKREEGLRRLPTSLVKISLYILYMKKDLIVIFIAQYDEVGLPHAQRAHRIPGLRRREDICLLFHGQRLSPMEALEVLLDVDVEKKNVFLMGFIWMSEIKVFMCMRLRQTGLNSPKRKDLETLGVEYDSMMFLLARTPSR